MASTVSSDNEHSSRTPPTARAGDFGLPLAAFIRQRWPETEAETGRPVESWPPPASDRVAPFKPSANPYASNDARLVRFFQHQKASEQAAVLKPRREAYERVHESLLEALQSGEIVASARPGAIDADLQQLPPVAWTRLKIVNWNGAIARNRRDRRPYYDLHLAEPAARSTPPETVKKRVLDELQRMAKAGE